MDGKPSRSRRPTYLLNSEPDEFERWRAAAESTGESFAAYVRTALDERTAKLARAKQSPLPKWLTDHYRHR